ncbi:MAG: hypothetical protein JXA94_07245 [Parachlamydiales bacterium]|nr:hypothetical protein [Parachlamydiales bacterium]
MRCDLFSALFRSDSGLINLDLDKKKYKILSCIFSGLFISSITLEGFNRLYLQNKTIDYAAIPCSIISFSTFCFYLYKIKKINSFFSEGIDGEPFPFIASGESSPGGPSRECTKIF